MRHRARRVLPIPGEVLVARGARVNAEDVVARTFTPGDVTPVNLANHLATPPDEIETLLLKKQGERIEKGEPLARTKGIFGYFKSEYVAPATGFVESVSSVTGQVMIRSESTPVQVRAYVRGEVVEVLPHEGVVVESEVAFVQGIFGVGGEAYGTIRFVCDSPVEEFSADRIPPDCKGAILVGGGRVHQEALRKAVAAGAVAIISGGLDDHDLRGVLGYDLGVAITGSESIGLTIVISEGFGEIAMASRTFSLLKNHEGARVSVNGATQIRAGVLRPEVVIPLDESAGATDVQMAYGGGVLEIGSRVRVIRDPYFGTLGRVTALPHEPQTLATGSRARVLEVVCDDGRQVTVPRANVEITG
jgi:hypothetical protein